MRSLFAALVAAAVLGALEAVIGATRTPDPSYPIRLLLGVGLATPVGLALAAVVETSRWALRKIRRARRSRGAPSRDGEDFDSRYGLLICTAAVLLVASVPLYFLLRRGFSLLRAVQDARLSLEAQVVVGLGAFALGATGTWAVSTWLSCPDRLARWAARLPRSSALRVLLLVWLPVVGLLGPLVVGFHHDLGGAASLGALVLLVGTWAVLVLLPWRPPAWVAKPRVAYSLLGVAAAGSIAAGAVQFAMEPEVGYEVSEAPLAAVGARLLRAATDFDFDGASGILEGGDCAPFDRSRGPRAIDAPDNGVDEDCDGSDAVGAVDGSLPGPAEEHHVFTPDLPGEISPGYNVVWVVIDALRADAIGARFGGRSTTPQIDALAAESLRFEEAFSQSSGTVYSFPSMLSGLNPGSMDWHKRGKVHVPSAEHPRIAEMLKSAGYDTAIVVNGYLYDRIPPLLRGYEERLNTWPSMEPRYWENRTGPTTTALAIAHLDKLYRKGRKAKRATPFFLTVYYEGPHVPYGRHGHGLPEIPDDRKGSYHHEVAYTDRQLGSLLDYLRNQKYWDRTVVVLTADHGEEFEEHGGTSHSRNCYVESTHVPLLLRIPDVDGDDVSGRVALIDVVPTLLELAGVQPRAQSAPLDGQSLLIPALTPDVVWENRPVYCALVPRDGDRSSFTRRSVRRGKYSLVVDDTKNKVELFDLSADPEERDDVSKQHSQVVRELEELLGDSQVSNR